MTRVLVPRLAALALVGWASLACTRASEPAPPAASPASDPVAIPQPPVDAPGTATSGATASASIGVGQTTASGCLASPDGTEQGPRDARSAAPEPPPVTVITDGGGVRVVHALTHACCLKHKVETQVSGTVVRVHVELSGTPCRCICSSSLTTTVRLSPGRYTVQVTVDDRGDKRREPEQTVDVK